MPTSINDLNVLNDLYLLNLSKADTRGSSVYSNLVINNSTNKVFSQGVNVDQFFTNAVDLPILPTVDTTQSFNQFVGITQNYVSSVGAPGQNQTGIYNTPSSQYGTPPPIPTISSLMSNNIDAVRNAPATTTMQQPIFNCIINLSGQPLNANSATSGFIGGLPVFRFKQNTTNALFDANGNPIYNPNMVFNNYTGFTFNLHWHGLNIDPYNDGASEFIEFGNNTSIGPVYNIQLGGIKNQAGLVWVHAHPMYYSSQQLQMGIFGLVDIIDDVSASVGQDFFNVPVAVDPSKPNLKIFTGYDDDHLMMWFFDTDLNPDGSLDKRNLYVDNTRDNFLTVNQTTVFPWYAEQGTVPYTVTTQHNSSKNIVKLSLYNTGLSWRPGYVGVCDLNGNIKPFYYIQADDSYRNPCLINIVQWEPANRGSIVFDLQDFTNNIAYVFFYNIDLTNIFNMQVSPTPDPVTGLYDLQGNETYPSAGNGNNTINPTPIPDPNNINPDVPSHIQYPKLFYLGNPAIPGCYVNTNLFFNINGGYIPCPDLTTVDKKYFLKVTWADNTVIVNNPLTPNVTSFTKTKSKSLTDLPTFVTNVRKVIFGTNYNTIVNISRTKGVSLDSPSFEKDAFTYPDKYINYLNPNYYINLPLTDDSIVPSRNFSFTGTSPENYFDPQNQQALTPQQGLYGYSEFITSNRILVDMWNNKQLNRDKNGIVTDSTSPWYGVLQGYVNAVNAHTNNTTPVIYKPVNSSNNLILPSCLFKVTQSAPQFTNLNMLANDTFYIDIFDTVANTVLAGTNFNQVISPSGATNLQGISYFNSPNTPFVWVVDRGTNTVYKYNITDYSLISTTTNPATGSFQPFNSPVGICSDTFQTYVTNSGNDTYAVINNSSGAVTSYWPIGNAPNGMVLYTDTVRGVTSLWVVNQWVYTVSKINIVTNDVELTVPVGDNSTKICAGGGYLWVIDNGANLVSQIDPINNVLVGTTVQTGNLPTGICSGGTSTESGGTYIWVTNSGSNNITQIDSATLDVNIINGPFNYPNSCVSGDSNYVWITNNIARGEIVEYNILTGAFIVYKNIDTVSGVVGANPQGIAWDGTYLWVANNGFNVGGTSAGTISRILPDHVNGVVNVIQGFGSGPTAITYDSTNHYVWVTCANDNTVNVYTNPLNVSSPTIVTDSVGSSPIGICTNGSYTWVANNGENSYCKIDAHSNVVSTINFPAKNPTALSSDGLNLWITNQNDSTVTQVYIQTNSLIQTLQVGANPNAIYSDGVNVWVANTGDQSITQISCPSEPEFAFAPGRVVQSIPTAYTTPTGIYSNGTNVYVCFTNNSTTADGYLGIYNIAAGTWGSYIRTGPNPVSMSVDSNYIWVLNEHNHTVSQISLQDTSIVYTSSVGDGSGTGVFGIVSDGINIWVSDSVTNNLYLSYTSNISNPDNNYPYYADDVLFAYPGTNIGTTAFSTNNIIATVKIVLAPTGNNYDSLPQNIEVWCETINNSYTTPGYTTPTATTTITWTDPSHKYFIENNGTTHTTDLSTFLSLDWTYYPYYQPGLTNSNGNEWGTLPTYEWVHTVSMINQNKSNRYLFRYAGKWETLNLLGKTPAGMFMPPFSYANANTVPQSVPPPLNPNNPPISVSPPFVMNHPPIFNMDGTLDIANDPYAPANSINMMNYPALTASMGMYPNVINGLIQEIYPVQADPLYPYISALGGSNNPSGGLMLNMSDVVSFSIPPVNFSDPILNINYSTILGDHNGIWKGIIDGFQNDNLFNFTVEQEMSEKWYYHNWDVQDSHPFHFHLTSGFVDPNDPYNTPELFNPIKNGGELQTYSKDTYSIGSQTQMSWYLKFSNFNGTSTSPAVFPPISSNLGYMYHCHFMTHHDMMMMGQYFVTPQNAYSIYFPGNDPN